MRKRLSGDRWASKGVLHGQEPRELSLIKKTGGKPQPKKNIEKRRLIRKGLTGKKGVWGRKNGRRLPSDMGRNETGGNEYAFAKKKMLSMNHSPAVER